MRQSREAIMTPPRSAEEKEVMASVGWWRGVVYPPLFLSISSALFIKFRPGMYDKFLRMRRTLATIGISSFAAIGIMEFYVENRILSQKLPEGFYKWQYKQFSDTYGSKLRLNYAEADEYWEKHPIEQKWRFQFRAFWVKSRIFAWVGYKRQYEGYAVGYSQLPQ